MLSVHCLVKIKQELHVIDKASLIAFGCLLVGDCLRPHRQLGVLDYGDPCNAIAKRKLSVQHGDDFSVKMTEYDIAHANASAQKMTGAWR